MFVEELTKRDVTSFVNLTQVDGDLCGWLYLAMTPSWAIVRQWLHDVASFAQ